MCCCGRAVQRRGTRDRGSRLLKACAPCWGCAGPGSTTATWPHAGLAVWARVLHLLPSQTAPHARVLFLCAQAELAAHARASHSASFAPLCAFSADSTMVMLQGAIGQARPAGFRPAAGYSSTMPSRLRCVNARVSVQHLFGASLLSVTAGECRSGASLPTARRCNIRTWPVRGAPLGVTRKPVRRGRRTAYSPPGRASAYLCFLALVARGTAVGAASRWARSQPMASRRVLISALIAGGARAHRSNSMRLPTSAFLLLWRVVCNLSGRASCLLSDMFQLHMAAFPATRCPLLRCSTVLCSRRRADLSPTKTLARKTSATNATGGEVRCRCACVTAPRCPDRRSRVGCRGCSARSMSRRGAGQANGASRHALRPVPVCPQVRGRILPRQEIQCRV